MKKIFTLFAALVCMMCLQAQTVAVEPNGDVCKVTVNGTVYENLPVTTNGDIHLVAINREGISLLVRYTDTNTVSAIGTVNGQAFQYASDAVAAYAKTFQIPNSDFEEWSSNSDITEPRHWHGFKSATGDLAGSATSTLLKSTDVRNGASGYSAVIASKSIWGVIANGTMTNGRLMAQSMTAENTWNHSEMDQNSTATDNYGDSFFTALLAKPDAIKTWLKFSQGTANTNFPYATMSAILFDGDKYQDPEPKVGDSSKLIGGKKYTQDDADYAAERVAAKAKNTTISTCGWSEFTLPFAYTDTNKAKAILVTISTNATPGKGSANDQVWIDDMELVYNAAISNIALNGVTLEGFNFDAATKSYDLTYSGEVVSLTADNFAVTAEGKSAMVVKNVEDLGCGNYRIAIGVTSPDFKNSDLYTINLTHDPLTGKLYILGDVNGIGWHANNAVEMDANEDQTIFTAEVSTQGDSNYFNFTTKLAENDDLGGWAYIKPYRIGAPGDGEDASILIESSDLGTALPLGDWGKTRAYYLPAGSWEFTVDLTARTLTVVEKTPDNHLYILGDVNGKGWHANDGVEMTPNEEHTIFTATVTTAGENNYFRFTTELAMNDDDGGWAYIMPFGIGAETANQEVALNTALPLKHNSNNFVIGAGKWDFSVNLDELTLTVTKVQQSIPGDVNGDGTVDVADVNIVINIILHKDSLEAYPNANIDGNEGVDVSDVNALVNIMLHKN